MELSFEWLENEKPLITLHKSKIWQFRSLFDYYGFELEQKKANYYNIFSTELVYNGILPDKKFIIGKFKPINLDDFCWEFIRSGRSDLADFFVVWYSSIRETLIYSGTWILKGIKNSGNTQGVLETFFMNPYGKF